MPLVEYPGGKEEIFGVRFAPHTNAEFVSYGVKHLRCVCKFCRSASYAFVALQDRP